MSGSAGWGLWLRTAVATAAAAALYGFALGSAHSELYATRNLLKFPLLIAVTSATCAVSWWVVGHTFALPLSFGGVQRSSLQWFRDAAFLLGSLAPIVFFLARAARARDDGVLGEYDSFLALNMAAVAVCGAIALAYQGLRILRELAVGPARAAAVVMCWLSLTLAVGGQAAFWMRPFFGFPATRGNTPPFFLGTEPDKRGATNFYEAVWQTVVRPPLPETWY